MAWAKVQSATAVSGASVTTLTATFPASGVATKGNLLVAVSNCDSPPTTPTGWTQAVSAAQNSQTKIYYKVAAGGETGVTVTQSPTSSMEIWVAEWSGNAAVPLDVTVSNLPANTPTSCGTGTLTTTKGADLLIGAVGTDHADVAKFNVWTGTGFTATVETAGLGGTGAVNTAVTVISGTSGAAGNHSASLSFTVGIALPNGCMAAFFPGYLPQPVRRVNQAVNRSAVT